ncbi:MAG TPA: chromosome segregation protein SMC [Nitrospirales bacterium]|nr:chromosome segregation protein SMC [Nitrospirales bacterium]
MSYISLRCSRNDIFSIPQHAPLSLFLPIKYEFAYSPTTFSIGFARGFNACYKNPPTKTFAVHTHEAFMHLKQLDIIGFKSFVEASVTFGTGITALVGPNGTGKSNLVDAVLWALGEQSPKSLRVERMEDTIFNGAASKPPLGMAEVSLTLTGLPGDEPDVTISRRLFRDGQSEYAINKKACRLRDVRDLFFDLGASSKGCTVIEQGKLDALLQSSAQERRAMIEETAGTMRYKKQRAATMQKIEASRGNLLRLRDLIGELKRQQGTLKRQARAAETYKTIHDEIRTLELSLLKHDHDSHRDRLDTIETRLALAEEQETEQVTHLSHIGADRERARNRETEAATQLSHAKDAGTAAKIRLERALEAGERQYTLTSMCQAQLQQVATSLAQIENDDRNADAQQHTCQDTLDEVQHDIEATATTLASQESDLNHAQEQQRMIVAEIEQLRTKAMDVITAENTEAQSISAMEARQQELVIRQELDTKNHEALANTIGEVTERQHELATQVSDVEQRWEQYQDQAREHASKLQTLRDSHTRLIDEERTANEQVTTLESRRSALQGVLAEQWSSYGEQGPQLSGTGIRGTIAEVLQVPPQYERAIEVALGERLRGVIVDGHPQAREAIDVLRKQGLLMGTFIPLHPRMPPKGSIADATLPGIVAIAQEVVTTTIEFSPVIDYLLDGVVIVDNLHSALQLWEHHGNHLQDHVSHPLLFVTVTGEYVDTGGVLGVGSVPSAMGLLQRQREVKEIEAQLTDARSLAATTRGQCEALATQIQEHTRQQQEYEANAREEEIQLVNVQHDKERTDQELHRFGADHQRLTHSLETNRHALASIAHELTDAGRRKETFAHDRQSIDQLLTQRQHEGVASEGIFQTTLERVNNTRLTQHTLFSRRDGLQSKLASLEQAILDRKEKKTQLEHEHHRMTEQWHSAQNDAVRLEDSIHALKTAMASQDTTVATAQAHLDQMTALTRTHDTTHTNTQKTLEEIRQKRNEFAIGRAEHTTSLDHIATLLSETYEISMETVQDQLGDVRIDVEQTRAILSQRRQRRDRLGPINLAAAEESQALDERLSFLTAEENDLLQSIASLEDIMTRLNDTTSQLFQETFQALRKTFNDLFSRLFEGGMADLVLDDPDPITAGIDIVAQPPGKRLKQLSLLSGGEKALTAFALILASYLLRPTPLCVLDETDAPLDDENIARFVRLLQEVSASAQFLIITHNKQTMAAADKLYGTTMAEPGITILLSASLENTR